MTQSNPGTTAIYLQGGREALRDEHFVKVATGISLREVLR